MAKDADGFFRDGQDGELRDSDTEPSLDMFDLEQVDDERVAEIEREQMPSGRGKHLSGKVGVGVLVH